MYRGWHVSAKGIQEWSATHTQEALGKLSLLVRELVVASVDYSLLHFPTCDSVFQPGWDGILHADDGNAFVPSGKSYWEFSIKTRIKGKADEMYKTRTAETPADIMSTSTFVFVTSRAFKTRDDWVREKEADGRWAQVRVLNRDDLEAWIEQCPPVHRWFARLIGNRPPGAWDIGQAWDEWSAVTNPPSAADLAVGGRDEQASRLEAKLRDKASVTSVFGESREEAIGFTLAVVNRCPDLKVRLLEVTDPLEWDQLLDSQQSLILIPHFDTERTLALAPKRGHHVIRPCWLGQPNEGEEDIVLGRPNRERQVNALASMGIDDEKARDIVRSCRGYLVPIRRHSALAPGDYTRPEWASAKNAPSLIAALMAGSWDAENHDDCTAISKLAGSGYEETQTHLDEWALCSDPPLRRVRNIWQVISRHYVWNQVSPFIGPGALKRLGVVVQGVLTEQDPSVELPTHQRWMAGALDKVTKHSTPLRRGLAGFLVMLATYGDRDCKIKGGISVQDQVTRWVRELLPDDATADHWYSLGPLLPHLAEAAPEAFLDAVDSGLRGNHPAIMDLFTDEGFMSGSRHVSLLWALEGISWNLNVIARVARVLARLARLDPGGRTLNRPQATLRNIFLGWYPQTRANTDTRIEIIRGLIDQEPEVTWHLLLDLLPPRGHSSTTDIYKPLSRDWADAWSPKTARSEWRREGRRHTSAIADMILALVSEAPDARWPELVARMPQLPEVHLKKAIGLLKSRDAGGFSPETLEKLRDELRKMVHHHRQFPNADWALPKNIVDELESVYQMLTPDDPVLKYKYLFDEICPEVPGAVDEIDYTKQQQLRDNARKSALAEIWESTGFEGIERLVALAKAPVIAGFSLGRAGFRDEIQTNVLDWLGHENTSLDKAAKGYLFVRHDEDPGWIDEQRSRCLVNWTVEHWGHFCLGLPLAKEVSDFMRTLPKGVSEWYWTNIQAQQTHNLSLKDSDCVDWVLKQLIRHRRFSLAVSTAGHYLCTIARKTGLSGDTLARILELGLSVDSDPDSAHLPSVGQDITEVLKALETSADIEADRLGRIEWACIQVYKQEGIRPSALLAEIGRDPGFYAEVISFAYPAEPPIEGEFSDLTPDQIAGRAKNAYHLLESIDRLPRQAADAEIDADELLSWVEQVRVRTKKQNREKAGDKRLGDLLSHSSPGSDSIWPQEGVRRVLQQCESRAIETGLVIGRLNQGPGIMRAVAEGGEDDRKIADRYELDAQKVQNRWPRTAAVLRRLKNIFAREGDRDDDLRELRDW